MDKPYLTPIAGLPEAVAAAKVAPRHKALLGAMSQFERLRGVRFLTSRGGGGSMYRVMCKVLNADGQLVSEDRDRWLAEQLDGHGSASSVYEALKDSGYMVSKCEVENLYFVIDRGGPQANFAQIQVDVLTEYVDRPLFDWFTHASPRDLHDLQRDAAPAEERKLLAAPAYELNQVVDVPRFFDLARALHEERRQLMRQRKVVVSEQRSDGKAGDSYVTTLAGMDEDFERFPWWRGERLLHDWTLSSAGRSGARLCQHWVLEFQDYQHPMTERSRLAGQRFADVVPMWTHRFKMAEVKRAPSVQALYDKLLSIDRRTRVPFAWFFYLLHGNRVNDGAGRTVFDAAERGEIMLPEHDYQVLRRWNERPYGF